MAKDSDPRFYPGSDIYIPFSKDAEESRFAKGTGWGSYTTLAATTIGLAGKIVTSALVCKAIHVTLDGSKGEQLLLPVDGVSFKSMNYLGFYGQDNFVDPTADWATVETDKPFSSLIRLSDLNVAITSFMAVIYLLRAFEMFEKRLFGNDLQFLKEVSMGVIPTLMYHILDCCRFLTISLDVLFFAWAEIFYFQINLAQNGDSRMGTYRANFILSVFLASALSHIERQITSTAIAMVSADGSIQNRQKYLRPVRSHFNRV